MVQTLTSIPAERRQARPGELYELSIRYIPILCSLPLLYAHHAGIFAREGLSVDLRPAPGWSAIKELLIHGRIDAAHMLLPMPLACSAGIDGMPAELRNCLVQNVNGQALVMAHRHSRSDASALRGLTFGVPYQFSMQFYLLCHHLTRQGIDPLRDVRIIEVAPPRMPQYLADGAIDGFFGPEPYVQLAVGRGAGYIALLSKQVWPGHPCCCLATSAELLARAPQAVRALQRSVLQAQRVLHDSDRRQREALVEPIAEKYFPNIADRSVIGQALSGCFPDGRGQTITAPDHIDYLPSLHFEIGEWIVSQMQRWGQLPIEVDRGTLARRVLLAPSVATLAPAFDFAVPAHPALPIPLEHDIRALPFAAPRERRVAERTSYEMADALRSRLRQMLDQLSEATAGGNEAELQITSNDEIGWLEQMINEVIRNARFARQATEEKLHLEAEARRQQQELAAQKALLRQLSIPVIPLLPQVLLLPLIGDINEERLQQLCETLLDETTQRHARIVLLDVTGLGEIDERGIVGLRRSMAAVRLLGARCILVGVTSALSMKMIAVGGALEDLLVQRDVASALAYALNQLGIVLGLGLGPGAGPRKPR